MTSNFKDIGLKNFPAKTNPPTDCALCPRLVEFRKVQQKNFPDWHNAPVDTFGATDAQLLVVGMAPGLKGANATGRPFTGDYAGDLLYATLDKFGFSRGNYQAHPNDGLELVNCAITNAVRCVPPQNKPVGSEINNCRDYLVDTIRVMPRLKILIALGRIAHENTLRTLEIKLKDFPFAHGAIHKLSPKLKLLDSYHCSRYNTNTGRLTEEMFEDIFTSAKSLLSAEN